MNKNENNKKDNRMDFARWRKEDEKSAPEMENFPIYFSSGWWIDEIFIWYREGTTMSYYRWAISIIRRPRRRRYDVQGSREI